MENNAFLLAAKTKLRFATSGGQLAVEDLFDLSLRSLDSIAVAIDNELGASRKTFLTDSDAVPMTKSRKENELRLEVLKSVITEKQADAAAKKLAADNKARKEFLLGLREKREMNNMEAMSIEEIDAQLAALG